MSITWRDDDILYPHAKLADLLAVDDLLQAHGCVHTIAIIAATLTPELGRLIQDRRMVPQLHCWEHDDLSVNARARAKLWDAMDRIEDLCGARPTVLYPTWNRRSLALDRVAEELGVTVSAAKFSLEQFIRHQGQLSENAVINFHFWHESDRLALAEAMQWVR